jgi:hypothetical protein
MLHVCLNGFDRILIRPTGDVSLCPIDWDCVHILGNVNEAPYTELWNNENSQQFRQAHIDRDYSSFVGDKIMCSRFDGKWVQDVSLRPQAILSMIAENLKSTNFAIDQKILYQDFRTNLDYAFAFAQNLNS